MTAIARPPIDTNTAKTAARPPVPTTIEHTGLGADQIEQLLVKTLHGGEASGLVIADRIRLSFTILEPLIERLRAERLIEVRGAASSGASSYRYALTDAGHERSLHYFEISRYVGPAPVPLAAYVASMTALAAARPYMDRERLRHDGGHRHARVQGRGGILEDDLHLAPHLPQLAFLERQQVAAAPAHLAAGWLEKAEHGARQRRFPAPALADDAQGLAGQKRK